MNENQKTETSMAPGESKDKESNIHLFSDNIPVYFDGEMQLFDKKYQKIKRTPIEIPLTGPMSFDGYRPGATFPEFDSLIFPNFKNFNDFEDFCIALLTWKTKIKKFTDSVYTPYPLLTKTFIPSRPSIIERNTPIYRKFDQMNNPLMPKNIVKLHEYLLSSEDPDLEEKFPYQIPKKQPVFLKHQMTNESQWQTQMMPVEPQPLIYETFEDYEVAFINWFKATKECMKKEPIKPQEFQSILNINKTTLVKPKQMNIKKITEENKKIVHNEVDYSWVKLVKRGRQFFMKNYNFSKLVENNNVTSQKEENIKNNTIVFGVDKDTFISDFMKYGVHRDTLKAITTLTPFKSLSYYVNENADKKFDEFCESIKSETCTNLCGFLSIQYPLEKTRKYANILLTSKEFGKKYGNIFSPTNLNTLFDLASYSDQNSIRASYFIEMLTSTPKSEIVANYLLKKENVESLFKFTKLALCLSKDNVELFPIPTVKTEFALKVEQVHLASLLLSSPASKFYMIFECKLLDFCRRESLEIAKMIRNDVNIDELWRGVETNEPNEMTQIMFTLVSIHSENIIYALIGDKIFEKVIELSQYSIGRKFLFKIIFAKGGQIATHLIINDDKFTPETVPLINKASASILSLLIDEYSAFLLQRHCYAKIHQLNHILDAILHCYAPHLNPIIMSIIHIFANHKLVHQSETTYFDGIIGSFVAQVGILCTYNESVSFTDAMLMLEPCLSLSNCIEQILFNQPFVVKVMVEMNGASRKSAREAWKLFDKLVSKYANAQKALSLAGIDKPLAQIAASENPYTFRKFSDFIVTIANYDDPYILDMLESLLSGSFGRMACTYKNANKLFGNSPKAIQSIERMISKIVNTNGKFMINLTTHLSSLGIEWRRFVVRKKGIL